MTQEIFCLWVNKWNFPDSTMVKNLPANAEDVRDTGLTPGLIYFRKIPWSRKWQPTPVFLPGKCHGQRSLVGYSPWDHKEPDMAERLSTQIKEGKLKHDPFHVFSFIYLYMFLAMLGLPHCTWAFSSCSRRASHGSGLSCCRAWI